MALDDKAIVDLFFSRDETAVSCAKEKFGGRLYKTAFNILHSKEDAEECVSDTLMKAWTSIPPTRPDMLGAYLAKITRNLCLNKYNANRAAKRGGGEYAIALGELEDTLTKPADRPEAAHEAKTITAAINVFLTTLNKPARVAFVLRYFHGDSVADICQRFDMSESKVKSMLFRTRNKLRKHLEKEGVSI